MKPNGMAARFRSRRRNQTETFVYLFSLNKLFHVPHIRFDYTLFVARFSVIALIEAFNLIFISILNENHKLELYNMFQIIYA